METENPTPETQVDASHVNAATGAEAAPSADALTLEDINKLTGKNYKDTDTALKSIGDMSKQAGKASDLEGKLRDALEQPAEVTPEAQPDDQVAALQKQVATMQTDSFFAQNSDHAETRDLLEAMATANNMTLAEAVELPAYKDVMEKIASAPVKRTIAASNNRVSGAAPAENAIADAVESGDKLAMAKAVTDAFITK